MAKAAQAKSDDRIDQISAQVSALTETVATLAEHVTARDARSNPVVKTGIVDSGELALPRGGDAYMDPFNPRLQREEIEIPDGPITKDHAAELAFNEELVQVIVHESNDPSAEPIVEVFNNGVRQMFPRGIPVTCKRKFLEGLIRSKPVSYGNVEFLREDGVRAVKYPSRSSLRYPFQVLRDDNPRGPKWLQTLMAQH